MHDKPTAGMASCIDATMHPMKTNVGIISAWPANVRVPTRGNWSYLEMEAAPSHGVAAAGISYLLQEARTHISRQCQQIAWASRMADIWPLGQHSIGRQAVSILANCPARQ